VGTCPSRGTWGAGVRNDAVYCGGAPAADRLPSAELIGGIDATTPATLPRRGGNVDRESAHGQFWRARNAQAASGQRDVVDETAPGRVLQLAVSLRLSSGREIRVALRFRILSVAPPLCGSTLWVGARRGVNDIIAGLILENARAMVSSPTRRDAQSWSPPCQLGARAAERPSVIFLRGWRMAKGNIALGETLRPRHYSEPPRAHIDANKPRT